MIPYEPPRIDRLYSSVRLGQALPAPKITTTHAAMIMSGLTIFGAAAGWVGISTGMKENGALAIGGWTVGIIGGLGGLFGLTCLIRLATGSWVPGLEK